VLICRTQKQVQRNEQRHLTKGQIGVPRFSKEAYTAPEIQQGLKATLGDKLNNKFF